MPNCTNEPIKLGRVGRRVVEAALDGGKIVSDGGAPQRGRPRAAPRAMVNAALWILWTGAGWLTLPPHYPSPSTCRRHFERWLADGTWHAMTQRLAARGRVMECAKAVAAHEQSSAMTPVRATFCSALMR